MSETSARLLALLGLLQARDSWTGAELADRLAVTGRTVAPPLFDTMEVVGKDRCVERLRVAFNLI